MKEEINLLLSAVKSFLMTSMNVDCFALHVNSQMFCMKFLKHDGHRLKILFAFSTPPIRSFILE